MRLLPIVTCWFVFLAACDGPPPKTPADEPKPPEEYSSEPTEPAEPIEPAEPAEPAEPEPTATAPSRPPEEPKPVCKGRSKGLCKATEGCAWFSGEPSGCVEYEEDED